LHDLEILIKILNFW